MELVAFTHYLGYDRSGEIFNVPQRRQPPVDFLSKETGKMFNLINLVILSSIVATFGIVANVINMTVFYRQGFTTTTNISFFALAISDTMGLTTTLIFSVLMNPYLERLHINFIPEEVQHLTVGWFHVSFCRITSWITVFITAERCMGVALPLKVKRIITLKKTTVTMCLIFAINLFTLLPDYATIYWDWRFVSARNSSLLGVNYRSYKDKTFGVTYALTSTSGVMSFVCVIILTTFLVTKLTKKSKWRNKATGGSDSSETVSSRDKKTMQMIVMIASILIICYIPGTAVSFVSPFVPAFTIDKPLLTSYFSFWSIAFVFDSINSSVNIFIYYQMSTKYRHSFNQMIPMCINEESPPTISSI